MPQGQSYLCQGVGNGWAEVELDFGTVIACVNQPEELSLTEQLAVTVDDCKNQPLDLQSLPDWDGIFEPVACCGDLAKPEDVVDACVEDCGWAACKLAIGALRKAAEGIEYGALSGDLNEFANFLEIPKNLEACAGTVRVQSPGFAAVNLNEASSPPASLGHVNNLTLYIQCDLDDEEPTALLEDAPVCTEATNTPALNDESNNGGTFQHGAVTVFSSTGDASADLPPLDFEFTEESCGRDNCGFTLTRLDGEVRLVEFGDYSFESISYSLTAPAHGVVSGETVTFPAGSLRLSVTADAELAGEPIWQSEYGPLEVHNTSSATGIRTSTGFGIVDLSFMIGDHLLVASTERAPYVPAPR